jgi:hypothetical protein
MSREAAARSEASNGLRWAFVMLLLEALELLVVGEVAFFDRTSRAGFGAVELYLSLVAATLVGQVIGIGLVLRGKYRAGGTVQIVSSAMHVLKGEGLVGVIGGMRARAYGRASGGL